MSVYFITGTDTGSGKTLITSALLALANRQGMTTLGLKPLASGCRPTENGLRKDDALILQALSVPRPDYDTVNPYAYEPNIAPHLAAAQQGASWSVNDLIRATAEPLATRRDLILIEGAGGWRVPLNEDEDLAGLARRLKLPIILAVGLQLGCLNHARLTAEAIRNDGLRIAGWVGTIIEPGISFDAKQHRDTFQGNLHSLDLTLEAPCLGIIPRLEADSPLALAEAAADHLSLPDRD
jgi:dethiobiotin synthetase